LANDPNVRTTPDGKVPVIFRVRLRDPETFFLAQSFPIKNKDVIYVSNAPLADIQKFVNIVGSLVYPVISAQNSLR
ncbi:MAG: polysaccharide biosynthesis/export family protein, partial [Sphingomonas oligoaromativorans]